MTTVLWIQQTIQTPPHLGIHIWVTFQDPEGQKTMEIYVFCVGRTIWMQLGRHTCSNKKVTTCEAHGNNLVCCPVHDFDNIVYSQKHVHTEACGQLVSELCALGLSRLFKEAPTFWRTVCVVICTLSFCLCWWVNKINSIWLTYTTCNSYSELCTLFVTL